MMNKIDDDVSMSSSEDEDACMSSSDEKDDFSGEILRIDEYRTNIKNDKEDYDSHISLIKALSHSGSYEKAREAREEMNIYFPLSPEMWIQWVSDERKKNDGTSFVYDLFRRAIEDYRSVAVWSEFCQFSLSYFKDSNEIRSIFEEAVSQVGTQFNKGKDIWDMWIFYEKYLLNGLDGKAAEEQRDRIFKLYSRQLSVPLKENNTALDDFLEWNKDRQYPEDEIRTKYEECIKVSDQYEPFEKALSEAHVDYAANKTDPLQVSKEESWLQYLSFATLNLNKCEIVNLFERALTDICLSQPLWSNYLSYLAKNFTSDRDRILSTCKRSIRNNKSSLDLRLSLIRNMERFLCPVDEIRATLNAVFRAKLSDQHPFLPLWQAYIDFERRQLDSMENRDLTIIRGMFDSLVAIDNYLDYDPSCMLLKYWALIEARYGESMDKSREVWGIVRKFLGNNSSALWLENLEFERRFGDFESCKRLMSNAVNCFTDYPEYLFEKVLRCVAEDSTIENYLLFMKKIEVQQQKINEKRLKEAAVQKSERSEKKPKRKLEERKSLAPQEKKIKVFEKVVEESQKLLTPFNKIEKSEKVEYCEERCVFVSNLDFKATEKELEEIFGKCGRVEDVRIVKKLTGASKGFAYVQFFDKSDVEEAMTLEHAPLMDRPMYVNRCDPTKRHKFQYAIGETEKNKLFVKNLPKTVTKDALLVLFGKYGALKEVRLVTMKNGTPKGIAYVEYGDEASASRALVGTDGLMIDQNKIEVFLSKTPSKNRADDDGAVSRDSPSSTPRFSGDGVGVVSRDGPSPTPKFMVPRAVAKAPTTQKKVIHKSNVVQGGNKDDDREVEMKSNADFKKFL